jgi:predicted PurR-regulated permease PerM
MSDDEPSAAPNRYRAGPTDITDPALREEAKKAFVWVGIVAMVALAVVLAQPLMVVFGGLVFGAMIDGGARLLGRVLKIGRGWRVAIILLAAAAFIIWVVLFAGSQIADQAAALQLTIKTQVLRLVAFAASKGLRINAAFLQNLGHEALGGIGQVTHVVGGLLGGLATIFLIFVLGIYFAIDPAPYRRGLAWMLPSQSRDHFEETLKHMGRSLRRLLAGRLLGMTIEGVTMGIALWAYGVPMAALLGLLTGVLAFLPNIGAPISGALMILVGFSGGAHMGIYCIIVYLVVQTFDGNVVVPMVAKRSADLAPALVLGMQLVMGALFGILLERESSRRQGPLILPIDGTSPAPVGK